MHPSEVSGDGIEAGIIPSPVQVRAYSDAKQASWHASVTTCPSGPRIVPSCALNEPPLGTLQMSCVGLAQQPTLLASPLEVKLAGQPHEPASGIVEYAVLASGSPTCGPSCWHHDVPVILRHRFGAQHSSSLAHAWNLGWQAVAVSTLTCSEPSGDASASVNVFAEFDPHAVRESNSVDETATRIGLNAELVMRRFCRQSTRSAKTVSTVERPASDRDHSTPLNPCVLERLVPAQTVAHPDAPRHASATGRSEYRRGRMTQEYARTPSRCCGSPRTGPTALSS